MKQPLRFAQTALGNVIGNLALAHVSLDQAALAEGMSDQEREELAALRTGVRAADDQTRAIERRLETLLAARRARQATP